MKRLTGMSRAIGLYGVFLICVLAFAAVSYAGDEGSLEFKDATLLGRNGDQGASWSGMGITRHGDSIYIGGVDRAASGGQALALRYYAPKPEAPSRSSSSTTWAFWWPNRQGSGKPDDEVFVGTVATDEGLYFAGRSWYTTSDGVGDKEAKAILGKFFLSPPLGGDWGRPVWVAKPNFFMYRGNETYTAVTAATEGGSTFLYATGQAQTNGYNNTVVLAKYDGNGTLLWSKVLGNTGWFMNSYSHGIAVLNGSIYVSGYTHYPYYLTNNLKATLWKYDSAGNPVWVRTFEKPLPIPVFRTVTVAASGGFLYLTSALKDGPNGGIDVLLLKYDDMGNLIWSKTWGGRGDDLGRGITASEGRLFVVGETTSAGAGGKDAVLLEVDPATGEVLSAVEYGGAADDVAYGVQTNGNEVYVAADTKSFANGSNAVGQSDIVLLRYALKPQVIPVQIDIKPEGVPNSINLKSQGKIPVAILSTEMFDATTQVDPRSLAFGRTGSESSLAFCDSGEDVNGDGRLDLVCHFATQQTAFQPEDTTGVLRGFTVSHKAIQGTDSIRIVPTTR